MSQLTYRGFAFFLSANLNFFCARADLMRERRTTCITWRRAPDGRREVETRRCEIERCGRPGDANGVARTQGRYQRRDTPGDSEHELGRHSDSKAAWNASTVLENIVFDQPAGLRKSEGICSKEKYRRKHVDRCDHPFILLPSTRRTVGKFTPSRSVGTNGPGPALMELIGREFSASQNSFEFFPEKFV